MDLDALLSTDGYRAARARIASWKEILLKGGRAEALKVRDEKTSFFAAMRRSAPELYAVFQVEDRELSEIIYEKIRGKKVTID